MLELLAAARRSGRQNSTRAGSTWCSRWATGAAAAAASDATDDGGSDDGDGAAPAAPLADAPGADGDVAMDGDVRRVTAKSWVILELLDAADIGKLRQRRDSPFTVTACQRSKAYTLALPRKMRCSPTVLTVDSLKPFFARDGTPPTPGQVSDAGQEGEHEVELLLNCRVVRGVTGYLVRWWGHTSADDEWLLLEELAHSGCQEKVAEYDAAAPRRRAALLAGPDAAPMPVSAAPPPAPPPLVAPAGFRLAVPS